jgi:drug/metabolite transporter (DMT)-like permease
MASFTNICKMMKDKLVNWTLFLVLCLIWGSSFILMRKGMEDGILTPYHVASIRIFSAGFVLLPFAFKAWKAVPKEKLWFVILSGLLGSFFPAYLFCIAEIKISSSLAGILNALTPLFTIVIGVVFFQMKAAGKKWMGIVVGFLGLTLLTIVSNKGISFKDYSYSFYALVATILYGINVNLIGTHMKAVNSINIAAMAFVFLMIPSTIILFATGYFSLPLAELSTIKATVASSVLGIFGTAIASILFYMLLKRAGALFASMVTYGIPFVAILWGILDGELITAMQVGCLGIILSGVYLANR